MYGAVDDVLGAVWDATQRAIPSRLGGEPAEVTGLHSTPGAPCSAELGLEHRF